MCRPVSVSVKILQSTAICQVSGLWSWPYFSCNKYHLCFIVITTVSITASGSCCGRWKGGHPYGTAYHIKGVLCLGRFLQTSMVGHLRPNSIPTKSVGILAFISRSRNKTLIPGNSVCIIHRVSQMCTLYCEKCRVICCSHRLSCNSEMEGRVDLQTGGLGPLFQATNFIFSIPCERKEILGK